VIFLSGSLMLASILMREQQMGYLPRCRDSAIQQEG
jgi:hypothetical protein